MESIEDHLERCASANLDQQLWTLEYCSQFPIAGQDIDEAAATREIDKIITAAQEKNEVVCIAMHHARECLATCDLTAVLSQALGITGRLLYAIKECEVTLLHLESS